MEARAREIFDAAETLLREQGYSVVNPMKLNHEQHDKSWESYMKVCIRELTECDAVYMLPNYQLSKGAMYEFLLANVLKLEIMYAPVFQPARSRTASVLSILNR